MVTVLCFLAIRSSSTIWLLYVLSFVQFTLTAFFNPASFAILPQLVPYRSIVIANIVTNITWSFMLMGGAGIGAFATYAFGTDFNFVADAASYLLSAFCTWRLLSYSLLEENVSQSQMEKYSYWKSFKQGIYFLWKNSYFLILTLAKASGAIVWSAMEIILIASSRKEKFLVRDTSLTLGIMYLSSGFGVGFGSVIVRRFISDSNRIFLWMIPFGMCAISIGSICMGIPEIPLPVFLAFNCFRTLGSSLVWTYSETLLQRTVPNHLLGRVVSFEFSALTIASIFSRIVLGILLDYTSLGEDLASVSFGIVGFALTLLWFTFASFEHFRVLSNDNYEMMDVPTIG